MIEQARKKLSPESHFEPRQRISKLCFLAVAIVSTLPLVASGEDDATANARAKFRQGASLAEGGDFAGALAAFEESYSQKPKPVTLYNIANCQKALHRYGEAIVSFRAYLARAGDSPTPNLRTETKQALADLEPLVGLVQVEGAPQGAVFWLDGEQQGVLPLEQPLVLNPGRYSVKVTAKGYAPFQTSITCVAGAQITVKAALDPAPAESVEVKAALNPTSGTRTITPEDAAPGTLEEQQTSGLFIGGVTVAAIGAASAVVGLVFNIMGQRHADEAEQAEARYNENGLEKDRDRYNEIKNEKLPVDRTGMIVGYTVGGALIATGVILLVLGRNDESETSRATVAVSPTTAGIGVCF